MGRAAGIASSTFFFFLKLSNLSPLLPHSWQQWVSSPWAACPPPAWPGRGPRHQSCKAPPGGDRHPDNKDSEAQQRDKFYFFTFGFSRSIPRNSSNTSSSLARSKSSKSFDKIVIFRYKTLLVTFDSPLYNRPRWKSEEAERFVDRPSFYHDPAYMFGDSGWKDEIRILSLKIRFLPGFLVS